MTVEECIKCCFCSLYQAMQLDSTEVGVCYRLGLVAIQLRDFELALVSFQEVSKLYYRQTIGDMLKDINFSFIITCC